MVKWYNESLPRISGGFDSLWPHRNVKENASYEAFSFSKQTTLLACVFVRRSHVSAYFLKQKQTSRDSSYERSELVTCVK